jgi:hypothetical protein
MKPAVFGAVLATAIAGALGAVAANLVVGSRLFERTVVDNPYETGLRYDEDRRRAEAGAARARLAAPTRCDLARGPCSRPRPEGGALSLDLSPRPPRAMVELEFVVELQPGPAGVATKSDVTSGEIELGMPGMYMGDNRVALVRGPDGKLHGKGMLVRCPSGGRRWNATVTARATGAPAGAAPVQGIFTFEVAE